MGTRRTSRSAHIRDLAQALRAGGKTWPQIADVLRSAYQLKALTALRLAHGYSQVQVAAIWTQRWPYDTKTDKNISYWECWPGKCSREPSLRTLDHLAQIYQCAISDLLEGVGDHSYVDELVAAQPLWDICPHGCGCKVPA